MPTKLGLISPNFFEDSIIFYFPERQNSEYYALVHIFFILKGSSILTDSSWRPTEFWESVKYEHDQEDVILEMWESVEIELNIYWNI
jgi:hypothetical protein